MLNIFVSFSTSDGQDIAEHIHSRYKNKAGYNVFLSPRIRYGDEWKKEIERNIEKCNIFLLIATHGALESDEVDKEITLANQLEKRIIPCKHISVEWSDLQKWGVDSKQGLEFKSQYELVRIIHPQLLQEKGITLVRAQQNDIVTDETRLLASSKYDPSLRDGTEGKVPSAYIVIGGKPSKLQLEHEPMSQDRVAYYERPPQGTISFGERFPLIVPQRCGLYKDVKSATLYVNDDVYNENDYLQTDIELLNVRDTTFFYIQTYINGVPGGGDSDALGDGYTASEKGFKIFLWWEIHFTDGTVQTYLAVVRLKGDNCQKYGWDYAPTDETRCVDLEA
jgi:TIR domain-containing protein